MIAYISCALSQSDCLGTAFLKSHCLGFKEAIFIFQATQVITFDNIELKTCTWKEIIVKEDSVHD